VAVSLIGVGNRSTRQWLTCEIRREVHCEQSISTIVCLSRIWRRWHHNDVMFFLFFFFCIFLFCCFCFLLFLFFMGFVIFSFSFLFLFFCFFFLFFYFYFLNLCPVSCVSGLFILDCLFRFLQSLFMMQCT
jgi:hypothetical protein